MNAPASTDQSAAPAARRRADRGADVVAQDRAHLWHPFTQMAEWTDPAATPVVIVAGEGALLQDATGTTYIDGNSSIWTNLHGHRRPELNAAARAQLDRVAHSSFLGLTNDVAPRLAAALLEALGQGMNDGHRVFLSDDGSTAIEAGVKMMHQARLQRGEPERTTIVSLEAGYHGDTVGAMSVGHSTVFHGAYRALLFPTEQLAMPACYRCPHNRAQPERGVDARRARKCNWECVRDAGAVFERLGPRISAMVLEPRVQGPAGMTMQPDGYLGKIAALCRQHGAWLMLDEVFTGFGRTGAMFAFHKEANVRPDIIALAKGLTGGYLPLAATVATREIYSAFLGSHAEFKTFFHGHSYSGNQLGCAVALASLELLQTTHTVEHIQGRAALLHRLLQRFWQHPNVGDVRCEGMIGAVELVADFATREKFPAPRRMGFRVSERARQFGLLTRPLGDVLLLMPPHCVTDEQLERAVDALWQALVAETSG